LAVGGRVVDTAVGVGCGVGCGCGRGVGISVAESALRLSLIVMHGCTSLSLKMADVPVNVPKTAGRLTASPVVDSKKTASSPSAE
jgi:hypothetical protein